MDNDTYLDVPYGTVFRHPFIRDVLYMVIGPGDRLDTLHAICIQNGHKPRNQPVGRIARIGGQKLAVSATNWIVLTDD